MVNVDLSLTDISSAHKSWEKPHCLFTDLKWAFKLIHFCYQARVHLMWGGVWVFTVSTTECILTCISITHIIVWMLGCCSESSEPYRFSCICIFFITFLSYNAPISSFNHFESYMHTYNSEIQMSSSSLRTHINYCKNLRKTVKLHKHYKWSHNHQIIQ